MQEIEDEKTAEKLLINAYDAACCCEECFDNALGYVALVKKFKVAFAAGLAAAAGLMLIPIFVTDLNLVLLALGWLTLGGTMVALPFATQQTIETVGIKKGTKTCRVIGIILILSTPIWMILM